MVTHDSKSDLLLGTCLYISFTVVIFFQVSKLTLFKEFEDAKANYEDAVKRLQTLEEQRHQLHANLKEALETKNKFEAKEFGNQRSLDKASGDLKVNNCQLKYVEQNLQQLSDQMNLKKYNLAD